MSKFTQNLVKPKVNQDAFWSTIRFNIPFVDRDLGSFEDGFTCLFKVDYKMFCCIGHKMDIQGGNLAHYYATQSIVGIIKRDSKFLNNKLMPYLPTFMFYIKFIIHGLSTSVYSDFFELVYVQRNGERNFHSPYQGYSI